MTLFALIGALILVGIMMVTGNHLGKVVFDLYEVTLFSQFLKIVFLLVSILVVLVSLDYAERFRNPTEYYTLITVATVGMMVVASARDFITLFIGLETASLSSYILAGYLKNDGRKVEASVKYFVVGALSSAILLYGISLVYGITGTLQFDAVSAELAGQVRAMQPVTLVAITLLLVGIGFKITAVPFHMYAPDVYYGAPDTVSAFLSGGSKIMGFAAALKVFVVALGPIKPDWEVLLGIVAIVTMTLGNIVALRQTSMKRLLAYSSIAHAGYLLIAVVVGTQLAVAGGLFHFFTDAVMKGTAFLIIAAIALYGIGDRLDDMKGLRLRNPFLALVLVIMLFSLAGVPPFAGFASKFALFYSAVQSAFTDGPRWFVWLAIAGIANSLVSLFYYAKVVRFIYGEPAADETKVELSLPTTIALSIGLIIVIGAGILPQYVWGQALDAAALFVP